MKHIKSINEFYHRTVGYRYSKPTEKYSVTCYYQGNLSIDTIKEVLTEKQIEFDDVDVQPEQKNIKMEEGDVPIDGTAYFNIFVYTHKEIDKILADISEGLFTEVGVKAVDFSARPYPKNSPTE